MKGFKWVFAFLLCAGLAAAALFVSRMGGSEGVKNITISVTYEDGITEEYTVVTEAEHLLDAAKDVLELTGEDGPYGYTIYSINGVMADYNVDNAYWAVYVNGEYGTLGVEAQPLEDGGTYTFAYERY